MPEQPEYNSKANQQGKLDLALDYGDHVSVGDVFSEVFRRLEALEQAGALPGNEIIDYLDRIASSLESMDSRMSSEGTPWMFLKKE